MAFFGTITITQNSSIENFIITDTSDYGSEPTNTFSGRTIQIWKADGTLLVPEISWPFASGNTYTLSGVLTQDYSLSVIVNWNSLAPQPGSTYTVIQIATFLYYLRQFLKGQISNLSDDPNLLNDTNWYTDMSKLQVEINNAIEAGTDGQQYSSQAAISRGYYLMNNSQFFF